MIASASTRLRIAHIALPVLLRALGVRRSQPAYDLGTVLLAAAAGRRPSARSGVIGRALCGAVVGALLPVAGWAFAGSGATAGRATAKTSRATAGRRGRRAGAATTVAVALAEEVVWRSPPPSGRGSALAAVVGFTALHAPAQGWAAVWHLVTGAVFTACATTGGLAAAAGAHAAHNLVLELRPVPSPSPSPAADLPSSTW